MFNLLDQSQTHQKGVLLQDNGQVVVKTVSFDADCVENTKAHRHNESTRTGDKFEFHDGASLIYHFQAEQSTWDLFKRNRRDLYTALQSADQIIREKAAATVAALYPHWVVAAPNARSIL